MARREPSIPAERIIMRHSLFFDTIDEAQIAETHVNRDLDVEVLESYQSNDGETGAIEVRFFTNDKLSEREQRYLIKALKPATYALNCEEF